MTHPLLALGGWGDVPDRGCGREHDLEPSREQFGEEHVDEFGARVEHLAEVLVETFASG
jgi:hypothetical protein